MKHRYHHFIACYEVPVAIKTQTSRLHIVHTSSGGLLWLHTLSGPCHEYKTSSLHLSEIAFCVCDCLPSSENKWRKYQGPLFEQRFRIKSNNCCLSNIFRGWPTGFAGKAQWYLQKQATGNCWEPSQLLIFFKPDCFFRNAVILPSLSFTANEWIKCLEYWIVNITIRDNYKVRPFYFFCKVLYTLIYL